MTIEQLAEAYRAAMTYANTLERQAQEARDLCDKALMELEDAFKALGFEVVACNAPVGEPVCEPKLNITDWRNLQEGDRIRCVGGSWAVKYRGKVMTVLEIADGAGCYAHFPIRVDGSSHASYYSHWGKDFEFISRP